jgi:hypothetical protein
MMIAATDPVAVCFFLSFSPQCGQVSGFGEICRSHVVQLINFVTDFTLPAVRNSAVMYQVLCTDVMSGAA